MRISDWSSDVCSSDLRRTAACIENGSWPINSGRALADRGGWGNRIEQSQQRQELCVDRAASSALFRNKSGDCAKPYAVDDDIFAMNAAAAADLVQARRAHEVERFGGQPR